jgi:putative transcriptional regulator
MDKKNTTEIKAGDLLLATPILDGTYFEGALILIVIYNEEGAFGLTLNRSSVMPIREVFDPVPDVIQKQRRFYIGGPVDEDSLHILRLVSQFTGEGYPFTAGVELGGDWDSIEELLISDEYNQRLFLGYTGWDSGQLEGEVDDGRWEKFSSVSVKDLLDEWLTPPNLSREEIVLALKKMIK